VKPASKTLRDKPAFTIIELLTVMSIIIILIGLLVPALTRVKRYARLVKQKAQFHSIGVALDLFSSEYDGYPNSSQMDGSVLKPDGSVIGVPYCGAMKLAEAMVGQDFKGFHPDSRFRQDGLDGPPGPGTRDLYPEKDQPSIAQYRQNLKARHMFLQLENASANTLETIFKNSGVFDPCSVVLCDVYNRATNLKTAKGIGMPILYYRADTAKTDHVASSKPTDIDGNIYDVRDNQQLINIPLPWSGALVHPMAGSGTSSIGPIGGPAIPAWPGLFYEETLNPKVPTRDRPYRADSYLLLSAGFDGEYGTSDDVWNF